MAWAQDSEQGTTSRTDVLRDSPPMFESRLLDACSRVHPLVPVIIFVPGIVLLSAWSLSNVSLLATIGLAIGGYALWTLFEYWLHRIVFHFEPEDGFGARLHWIIHGVHHEHPNDPLRLVMPPAVSIPLGAAVFGMLYLAFGSDYAPGLGAGFFAGYLVYDMLHYYVHHFTPRGRLGRMLRERHMRHHFQDETRGFGISAPYWDEVFRTSSRAQRGEH
jgi:sterol desaturase/sphingolipid hydroxylase (fatty acid hydroxylase superfamily)